MVEAFYKIGAYHEAGHAVMGYYSGFEIQEMSLLINDPGTGYTKFDYGKDNMLITAILNVKKDPNIFNYLSKEVKARTPQATAKICFTLIGGPAAEAISKYGIDYKGDMDFGIKDPDAAGIEAAEYVMSVIDSSHSTSYIQDKIIGITEILRTDKFWKMITVLAEKLLASKSLSKNEIESIFASHKFEKHPDV